MMCVANTIFLVVDFLSSLRKLQKFQVFLNCSHLIHHTFILCNFSKLSLSHLAPSNMALDKSSESISTLKIFKHGFFYYFNGCY